MSITTFFIPSLDPNLYTGPARLLAGIARTGTPVLDVPYNEFARWIYVGTAGNLSYLKWDGTIETLPNLVPGIWHPIFSIQINSAGTTIPVASLRWGS